MADVISAGQEDVGGEKKPPKSKLKKMTAEEKVRHRREQKIERVSELLSEVLRCRTNIEHLELVIKNRKTELENGKGYLKTTRKDLIVALKEADPDFVDTFREMIIEAKLEDKK